MLNNDTLRQEVKKLKLKETVLFVMNNVPQTDSSTLKQFLELASAGGTFGTISHEQVIKKMHQLVKYIPGVCVYSLLIVTDLLEIQPADQLRLSNTQARLINGPDNRESKSMAFFFEAAKVVNRDSTQAYAK